MLLHEIILKWIGWFAYIAIWIILILLCITILTFFLGVMYVWLKEFHPKTYKWIRNKVLRY